MLQGVPAAGRKADPVLRVQHTGLSRAGAQAVGGDGARTSPSTCQRREVRAAAGAFRFQDSQSGSGEEMKPCDAPIAWFHLDRKSTRLNSSHDQISYAVFC